jgi:hypothetical protein
MLNARKSHIPRWASGSPPSSSQNIFNELAKLFHTC